MNILVFDTETTGLLKPFGTPLEKQPYIIEFYGCVIDENFSLKREFESFFSVNFKLPEIIPRITGITDEMLEGQPSFGDMYEDLSDFFTDVDLMIAHNLSFDKDMLVNDLKRIGKADEFHFPRHEMCTVERTMSVAGYRLTLANLHYRMTGKTFGNAHRAKNDVHALVRSVHGAVEKGIIDFNEFVEPKQ
jgi:DNA polymerase III alpha subunit (gram-positive type)